MSSKRKQPENLVLSIPPEVRDKLGETKTFLTNPGFRPENDRNPADYYNALYEIKVLEASLTTLRRAEPMPRGQSAPLVNSPAPFRGVAEEIKWSSDWLNAHPPEDEELLPEENGLLRHYDIDRGCYNSVPRSVSGIVRALEDMMRLPAPGDRPTPITAAESTAKAREARSQKVAERWDKQCGAWTKIMRGNSGMSRTQAAHQITAPKDPKGLIDELRKRGLWDRKD